MAARLMRASLGFVLLTFLVTIPAAAAQAPGATLRLTATPKGGWDADGHLNAGKEVAMWGVDAAATFSNTAFCPDRVPITFELVDATGKTAVRKVQPASASVESPAGGGTRSVTANASAELPSTAIGGDEVIVRLHAVLGPCPSPAGTTPKTEANATLSVRTLLKPAIRVTFDNRSSGGTFNFTVHNTGNGPLLVGASVAPLYGSPDQSVEAAQGLGLDVGEFTEFVVRFPDKKPGHYEVLVTGAFNGPDADKQPRTEFRAEVEIPLPMVVRETRKAPGGSAAELIALGVIMALVRRSLGRFG